MILSLLSKSWSWNLENAIDFKWSDVQEDEEDIAKTYLSESLQKQADEEIYPKQVTGGLYDYYGIVLRKNKEDF